LAKNTPVSFVESRPDFAKKYFQLFQLRFMTFSIMKITTLMMSLVEWLSYACRENRRFSL